MGAVVRVVRCEGPWRRLIEKSVLPVVSRSARPARWVGGRTAVLDLDSTPWGPCVLKLKGLGREGGGPPGRAAYAVAPWRAGDVVPTVTPGSNVRFAAEAPAPDGGLVLDGALREFEAARILRDRGVPSIEPVAVVAYEGQEFVGGDDRVHPLGVAVTSLPEGGAARLSGVLRAFDVDSVGPSSGFTSVVADLYGMVGQVLRSFHRAGLVRHGSCLDNVGGRPGAPFLVDLDEARPIEEVAEPLAELMRDLCDGLFSAAIELVRPVRAHHPSDAVDVAAVFREFLRNYAPAGGQVDTVALARYVLGVRQRVAELQLSIVGQGQAGRKVFHENRLEVGELGPLLFELGPALRRISHDVLIGRGVPKGGEVWPSHVVP